MLPSGTVTFLFTDIEGSTQLWEENPEAMKVVLAQHDTILKEAVESNDGHVIKTTGDGVLAVFATAIEAVQASITAQRIFTERLDELQLKVRMGLHTGEAEQRDGDYYGQTLNRTARIMEMAKGGQILLSAISAALVRNQLPKNITLLDLGVHRLRGLSRTENIFQPKVPGLTSDFPPLDSFDFFPNNLPAQLTSFIDRENEKNEIKDILNSVRLVTLTGSGGTGKTRLAIKIGTEELTSFPDGVWLVELASIYDPLLIPQSILKILKLKEESGRTQTEVLCGYLRTKSLLLILDNCEHIISECAFLAETILKSASDVRILASSREPLGVPGERLFQVPSLSTPDPNLRNLKAEELSQFHAVQLFVERARLVAPSFKITDDSVPAIAQICHRLDGIPLAIELAAARIRTMPVEQIAERLDNCFQLLTAGSRTALPRQQTLRALIDWSYNLLSESERYVLMCVCIFSNGWTLEAAEAVCLHDRLDEISVLDHLGHLADKSLISVDDNGRYSILETVRQYGREKLLESGEIQNVRSLHADYFLGYILQRKSELSEVDHSLLMSIEHELDNLRTAMTWLLETKSPALMELASALGNFWQIRGYWLEGTNWLEKAISTSERTRDDILGEVKAWNATLDIRLGRTREATRFLMQCQEIAERSGNKNLLARIFRSLGTILWGQGEYESALSTSERALDLYRELDMDNEAASVLTNIGNIQTSQGNFKEALNVQEESAAILRKGNNKFGLGLSLNNLGYAHELLADYDAAREAYEESIQVFNELGDKGTISYPINGLAHVLFLLDEYALSLENYKRSLEICEAVGDKRGIAYCFEGIAKLAIRAKQNEYAIQLFSFSETLREEIDAPLDNRENEEVSADIEQARKNFDPEAFEKIWMRGSTLELNAVIKLVEGIELP